jgi:hypothetical protein
LVVVAFLVVPLFHHAPAANPSGSSLEREVQAVLKVDRSLAAARGGAPLSVQPAVAIIHDVPGLQGFSGAQIAQMLSALKPPTVEVIGAHLTSPTPAPLPKAPIGWTDAQVKALFAADRSAVASVISDPQTHIAVTVSRQEVAPTRIGSLFSPIGSGLSYAIVRKKQLELDVGAIQRAGHVSPAFGVGYLIPHTSLSLGPVVTFDNGTKVGASAIVHF